MAGNTQTAIEAKTAAIARYHAGCLRAIGAQNVGLRDLRTTRKAAYPCDLGLLISTEELLAGGSAVLMPPLVAEDPDERDEFEQRQLETWERLRELARKAAVEAHNKEVTYGYPLIGGALQRARRVENILAPLFTQAVRVDVLDDGSLELHARDEPPRFNAVLWTDGLSAGDADQVLAFGLDAQADLADGWDLERVRTLLNAIAAVFPALSVRTPEAELEEWPEREKPSDVKNANPFAEVVDGAAVYLANRSSPYLLADLERIAKDPALVLQEDHPVSILVSPPSDEVQPEMRSPDIDEVIYPFPSNGAQRRVADALDKNRIVVVQGPPGNGKSLTIANLASHSVAQGKSVLVTSHKDQALNVVRDKLEETDLQFLYASLIGSTGEAKRELQGQIADVTVFAGNVNADALRRQLGEVEKRRAASGTRYRELREDFNTRAENEQEKAAELTLELEPVAILPVADPVAEDLVAADRELQGLDAMARRHRSVWPWLTKSTAADCKDLSGETTLIREFLDHQRARLAPFSEAEGR